MIGVLIGVGCYILGAVFTFMLILFALNKKVSVRVYGFVAAVSAVLHAVGTVFCVASIDLNGWQLALYALVMTSLTVVVWVRLYKGAKIFRK